MEQSNWSAAMLSLQMLKYYCRLSKKRMKKRKTVCFLTEKNNQSARVHWKKWR
ncbi:hypothetical protein [Acinetobacter calcoaceticus]|uniref:hypothetical protein n=1 Tax=Acinetobacter calcoaceticus TaxID=471 RepID=UPI00249065E9|nr:hypothetical protein [Acinetobacter calcoaceticus]